MEEEYTDESTKPGQYLAYEREKKGFTIEDIAGKLYLSVNIIRALEEDAYDRLPELVYVRGYIRSYCRILGIDPTPVLDMYAINLPREEDYLLEDLSLSSPVNEHQQQLILFWGSVAVIAIFLLLIIGWWQENRSTSIFSDQPPLSQDTSVAQFDVDKPTVSDIIVEQKTILPDAEIESASAPQLQEMTPSKNEVEFVQSEQQEIMQSDAETEIMPAELVSPPADQEMTQSDAETEIMPAELVSPPTDQEMTQSEMDTEIVPTQPVSTLLLDPIEVEIEKAIEEGDYETPSEASSIESERSDVIDPDVVTNIESEEQQIDAMEDMPQLLTLVVMSSGDSWARVRDGSDEIIIHRILPADYNKIFMVNLPLKFEFGNAHQVSLMIDGKDYDFSSYIRPSRTASFEITEPP